MGQPHRLGALFHGTGLASDANYKVGHPQVTLTSGQLAIHLGVLTTPLDLVILQNDSQTIGKLCIYNYNFIIAKGGKSDLAKGRNV